ncbi:MAG: response regulator transcription factor [Rhodanobacter sp.]|jgi:DNA-binding NarL/FixJ family response regulator|nr:response regulator transcription factor [Rhodanobacter sp.]
MSNGAKIAHSSVSGLRRRARAFVLSDTRLLRDGIVLALSQERSIEIVGSSGFSVSLVEVVDATPDVVLLDIASQRSLEISQRICGSLPAAKVVALAVTEVDEVVIQCANANVSGFVASGDSISEVVEAVHSAIRGEMKCSPRIAGILLSRLSALSVRNRNGVLSDELTPRERQIMRLMAEGMSNKAIARALTIQVATVKNHVHNILGKLGVHCRGEAAAHARNGLVEHAMNPRLHRLTQNGYGYGPLHQRDLMNRVIQANGAGSLLGRAVE